MIYASMPSPWRHLPQSRRPAPFDINPRQFRRHLFLALFRIRRHWGGAWQQGPPAERILMFPSAGYLRTLFFPDYDVKIR
jgi:hypothetical protein